MFVHPSQSLLAHKSPRTCPYLHASARVCVYVHVRDEHGRSHCALRARRHWSHLCGASLLCHGARNGERGKKWEKVRAIVVPRICRTHHRQKVSYDQITMRNSVFLFFAVAKRPFCVPTIFGYYCPPGNTLQTTNAPEVARNPSNSTETFRTTHKPSISNNEDIRTLGKLVHRISSTSLGLRCVSGGVCVCVCVCVVSGDRGPPRCNSGARVCSPFGWSLRRRGLLAACTRERAREGAALDDKLCGINGRRGGWSPRSEMKGCGKVRDSFRRWVCVSENLRPSGGSRCCYGYG